MNDRIPREEIEKWLTRIKKELKTVKANDKKGKEFLENINAYVNDCEHFLKKGEYVLSFESIVWSWSYLEIGKDLNLLD
jgi:hypothetical protein